MEFLKKVWAWRWFRMGTYAVSTLLVLFMAAWIGLVIVLRQNNIRIGGTNFDFAGRLALTNVAVTQPSLRTQINQISIDWDWLPLFSSRLTGNEIRVQGAVIELMAAQPDTTQANDTTKSNFSLAYHKLRLLQSKVVFKSATDSIGVEIPHFEITNLAFGEAIAIDSIFDKGTQVHWRSTPDSIVAAKPQPPTASKGAGARPIFSIGVLEFRNGGFSYQNAQQQHTISKLNVGVTELSSKDLLHASIRELSLLYQDTLALDFKLNKLTINHKEEGVIQNLALSFPWFALDLPEVKFATQPTPSFGLDIKSASVNTSLLKFLNASAQSLSDDVDIHFSGKAMYANARVHAKNILINTNGVRLGLNGFADVPGQRDNSLDLTVSNLKIASVELAAFLGLPLPPELAPMQVGSTLNISGQYNNLTVAGDILLNETPAKFSIAHQQPDSATQNIQATLKVARFNLATFYNTPPVAATLANVEFITSAKLDKDFVPLVFDLMFKSDSVVVNDFAVPYPNIALHYADSIGSGTININNASYLTLDSLNLYDFSNIGFRGTLKTFLPHLLNTQEQAGDLETTFSGYFKQSEFGQDISLFMQALSFKDKVTGKVYKTDGLLHVANNSKTGIATQFRLGADVAFDFTATPDFENWVGRTDRWDVDYPETALNLKLKMDSALIKGFTGFNGRVDISKIHFSSTKKSFESVIQVPAVQFEEFLVRELNASHDNAEDRKSLGLRIKAIENPYMPIGNLKINIGVQSDSVYALDIDSQMTDAKSEVDFDLLIEVLKNGYKIVPDERKPMRFGKQHWRSQGSDGLVFDKDFEMLFSHLELTNKHQKINALTNRDSVHISLAHIDLKPLFGLALADSTMTGVLNFNTSFHTATDDLLWQGSIDSLTFMEAVLGKLTTKGEMLGERLNARAELLQANSKVVITATKVAEPILVNIKSLGFDLGFLNALAALRDNKVVIKGKLDGTLDVTYDKALSSRGFLTLNKMSTALEDGLMTIHADKDTVWIDNYMARLRNFTLTDNHNNKLQIEGEYDLLEGAMNLAMETKRFKVLDAEKATGTIRGSVDIASKMTVKNPKGLLEISGHINALPNSSVTYVYTTSTEITLDERTKEMEFIAFDKLNEKKAEIRQFELAQETSDPIVWDVTTDIGATDVAVILNEATGDMLKMSAIGKLLVKTGSNYEPNIFGKIEGQSGRLIYDLPMVSDLDFNINQINVNWNGDMFQPKFSFEGSQVFRVTPNDISPTWQNNKDRVPVTVIAKVEEGALDNFDIHFDIRSTNQQVASWILTLPQATREQNAISLMVFGKINTSGTGEQGNALVQGMVTKMNELSRKNLKNTDLSFFVDSKKAGEATSGLVSNVGYSFSKPLFNKRFRITLGGVVDLQSAQAAQSRSAALGSIKLDYIVKSEPDITVNFTKRGTYDGVINGQIDESSVGLTFVKRFKNLFHKKPPATK